MAAATGSGTIPMTFRPAISPAFLVASFSSSPKYAGTVMTASLTVRCVASSASLASAPRMIAEMDDGVYSLPKNVRL